MAILFQKINCNMQLIPNDLGSSIESTFANIGFWVRKKKLFGNRSSNGSRYVSEVWEIS